MNKQIDKIFQQVLDEDCADPLRRFADLVRQDERQALAPPKREWVGLTLDDMPETYAGDKSFLNIAKWAEAKLKENNGGFI